MKKNAHAPLNAKELRSLDEDNSINIVRNPFYFILDNVYDTYNIGGLFRLADALSISKLYICGDSETPPNHKIIKASIGTYKIVPWAYKNTVSDAIVEIKSECDDHSSLQVIAVEQAKNSIPYTQFNYKTPLALIAGNETHGVSKEVLKICDAAVEIPMFGINKSLNVIVSMAIVGYHISIEVVGT